MESSVHPIVSMIFIHLFQATVPPSNWYWMVYGGKVRDFSHTSLKKWKDQIHATLLELYKRNQKVIYVGHSMGCLLGMMESIDHPEMIDTLFLMQKNES
jgi:pimeloyl-ACP methyl ester carboxylesterase